MSKRLSAVFLTISIFASSAMIPGKVESSTSSAVLVSMLNKVQAKTSERPMWHNVEKDNSFIKGDSVRTGSASRAEIKYIDGTITRIGSNTVLRIDEKNAATNGGVRTNLKLLLGKLWLKVTKGNGELKIETPTAIATVLGTELLVTNDENNISHVTTLDGLVEVSGGTGDKTLVKPGEWVEIAPGKPMEKPTKFDWDALKKNERFMLDPSFIPSPDDLKEDSNWK